jgi:hypothetical protein
LEAGNRCSTDQATIPTISYVDNLLANNLQLHGGVSKRLHVRHDGSL